MQKAIAQLLIVVALFFGAWFLLSKINWVKIFQIEKAGRTTEEKLGDFLWKDLRSKERELTQDSIRTPVESIFKRICEKNGVQYDSIHIEIIDKDDVNAFALPGNRIVVFSGAY